MIYSILILSSDVVKVVECTFKHPELQIHLIVRDHILHCRRLSPDKRRDRLLIMYNTKLFQ